MPGSEPARSTPISCQSIAPIAQCPMPATSVSGTACAISEPTMRAIGRRGYNSNSAVTPTAPAPTDEIDTSTPSTMPTNTVARAMVRSSSRSRRSRKYSSSALRKISEVAVSTSAKRKHDIDEAARGAAVEIELPQHEQREDAGGNAAAGKPPTPPANGCCAPTHARGCRRSWSQRRTAGRCRRRSTDGCRTAGSTTASSASRRRRRSCRPKGRRRNRKQHRAKQWTTSIDPVVQLPTARMKPSAAASAAGK